MIPGEIRTPDGAAPLPANQDLQTVTLAIGHTGDRPIQGGESLSLL